jgi:membrane protease subunit HflK
LKEESEAYKARIVAQAQGDAQRFKSILTEYQKAPQVTRDRMYVDAMKDVYSNVSKVLVDTRQSNQLLYLPLDKLMQQSAQLAAAASNTPAGATASSAPVSSNPSANTTPRTRDAERSRQRDGR